MNESDGSRHGAIAAIVAIPILIACCAAPVFAIGLVSATIGWFSGIGSMEMIGLLGITATAVFSAARFKRTKKKA